MGLCFYIYIFIYVLLFCKQFGQSSRSPKGHLEFDRFSRRTEMYRKSTEKYRKSRTDAQNQNLDQKSKFRNFATLQFWLI